MQELRAEEAGGLIIQHGLIIHISVVRVLSTTPAKDSSIAGCLETDTGITFDLEMNTFQTAGVWEIVQICPEMPNQRFCRAIYSQSCLITKGQFQC